MSVSIYILIDPLTEAVRYVGSTTDPKKRLAAHLCDRGGSDRARWIAFLKTRNASPILHVLEFVACDGVNDDLARNRERFWLDFYLSCGITMLNEKDPITNAYRRGRRRNSL